MEPMHAMHTAGNVCNYIDGPQVRGSQTSFHSAETACLENTCQSLHCEVQRLQISELPTHRDNTV